MLSSTHGQAFQPIRRPIADLPGRRTAHLRRQIGPALAGAIPRGRFHLLAEVGAPAPGPRWTDNRVGAGSGRRHSSTVHAGHGCCAGSDEGDRRQTRSRGRAANARRPDSGISQNAQGKPRRQGGLARPCPANPAFSRGAERTRLRGEAAAATHRLLTPSRASSGNKHAIARSRVLLFRWRLFHQRHAPLCQWRDRARLPESVCETAWERSFVVDHQRSVGLFQLRRRVCAGPPRRRFRLEAHQPRRRVRLGHPAHGAALRATLRTLPRRRQVDACVSTAATGMFRSLKNPNYRIWAAGALVSNVGTWMQRTAQDWLVLTRLTHHNASAVGTVMALQFGPQLLLLPWTGFAADHYNQRRLLMATQAIMGVLALALGLLTVTGTVQLWHVYVFAFLSGSAAAFDAPVRQTFVAELVGDADLSNAVALNSTSFNAGRMIGPAVSGIVIASVGTGWAFVLNGVSFLFVVASMTRFRAAELRPSARAPRAPGAMLEGLRYAWSHPE